MTLREMAEEAAAGVALPLDSSKFVRPEIADAIERVAKAHAKQANTKLAIAVKGLEHIVIRDDSETEGYVIAQETLDAIKAAAERGE